MHAKIIYCVHIMHIMDVKERYVGDMMVVLLLKKADLESK